MSAKRPCRLSQVASSWLILRPGSLPAPRSMSSTSRTSMSGVTLIFSLWRPLVPTAILMVGSPLFPARRSGRGSYSAFPLFGEQAEIIHTSGAHGVHHLDDVAEVGAGIRLQVDLFVGFINQAILHLAGQGVDPASKLVGAEVDGAIAHHRNQQRVFLVGVLHRRRIVHLG